MDAKTKILFLASNPSNTERLMLDEEVRKITEKIRASEHRDAFDLVTRWAVRPDDLLQELNAQTPTIVHFSGHGSSSGQLELMNDRRQATGVSPSALKTLFLTVKDNIRLVVLNACYSKAQAKSIVQAVDCVVGMNTSIGDNAAIAFAASFYGALGFGRSVNEAFEQGKTALRLEGIGEANTPELLVRRGIDASSVVLVPPAPLEPVEQIRGAWWGKVTTEGHESVLACIRIERIGEAGIATLTGKSFSRAGKHVADWRSLFSDVRVSSISPRIEFKYLYQGERVDKPALTLLFGRADVDFEVPTDPRKAVQRGESTFIGVYKSATATDNAWGNATQRRQVWVRAKDTSDFESLWTATLPKQRKPLIDKTLRAVWNLT